MYEEGAPNREAEGAPPDNAQQRRDDIELQVERLQHELMQMKMQQKCSENDETMKTKHLSPDLRKVDNESIKPAAGASMGRKMLLQTYCKRHARVCTCLFVLITITVVVIAVAVSSPDSQAESGTGSSEEEHNYNDFMETTSASPTKSPSDSPTKSPSESPTVHPEWRAGLCQVLSIRTQGCFLGQYYNYTLVSTDCASGDASAQCYYDDSNGFTDCEMWGDLDVGDSRVCWVYFVNGACRSCTCKDCTDRSRGVDPSPPTGTSSQPRMMAPVLLLVSFCLHWVVF